jgi:Rod binding domain-containing protein
MFVESMLPKDAEQVFGKGSAGNIWRSMMAEQIGNEMAKGKGIGIAQQLAKSRAVATPGTEA